MTRPPAVGPGHPHPEKGPAVRFLSQRGLDILAVLLLVGLFAYWVSISNAMHLIYSAYDPQFAYFMDSLAPFKGIPYSFADHPGTPVVILGTLFIALTWPFVGGTPAGLVDFHLRNPEVFFQIAYAFLFLAHLACALYFYLTARSTGRIGALPAVALAIMYYALDSSALGTIAYWSHASFSFPFGTLYLLLLFRQVQRSQGEMHLGLMVGMGMGAGILTSIILYLAPWVVGAVVTVTLLYRLKDVSWARTLRATGVLVLSSLAGFFVATIPHLWKWPSLWQWLLKLLLNQGRFGNGEPGIFSLSATLANMSDFITRMPLMFAALAALLVLWLLLWAISRRGPRQEPAAWSLAVGLLVQICLLLLITAKAAFYFYLLPVLATVPVLALVLVSSMKNQPLLLLVVSSLVVALVVVGASAMWKPAAQGRKAARERVAQEHAAITNALERVSRQVAPQNRTLRVLWGYGVFEQCNALLHGNAYTFERDGYSDELAQICPGQFLIPNGSTQVLTHGARVQIPEFIDSATVLVVRQSTADYLLPLLPHVQAEALGLGSPSSAPILIFHE